MILRLDRIGTELPPPSDPDPDGAGVVQELLGGKFGEMSTFMNYTFQSFNFRNKAGARPFYDLIASIAAEELGHVELVAMTIGNMLTGSSPTDDGAAPEAGLRDLKGTRNPQHFAAGGLGALCQDSRGLPWTGDNVFSSGDLIEDLTHNYFLETGARSGKLRVYEAVEHPAARALTGYLLVRGGVHQVAYARALENLTGADMSKLFPSPRVPTDKIPECQPFLERGEHTKIYRMSPDDYNEISAVFNGTHPETGDELQVVDGPPEGAEPPDPPLAAGRVRAGLRAGGDRRDRQPAEGQGRTGLGRLGDRTPARRRRRGSCTEARRRPRARGGRDGELVPAVRARRRRIRLRRSVWRAARRRLASARRGRPARSEAGARPRAPAWRARRGPRQAVRHIPGSSRPSSSGRPSTRSSDSRDS